MSHSLTDVSNFDATVTVPDDGDLRNAASVDVAYQALADRTRWLYVFLGGGVGALALGINGLTVASSNGGVAFGSSGTPGGGTTAVNNLFYINGGCNVGGAMIVKSGGGSLTFSSGTTSSIYGALDVASGGTFEVLSGGTFLSDTGSFFTLNGAATAAGAFSFAGSISSASGVVATWNGPHTFNSASTFNSPVALSGGTNLTVGGLSTLTGNVTCGGTLGVTGTTTHTGDVTCNGALNCNGTVQFNAGVGLNGATLVTGNVTLLTTGNIAWRVLYPVAWADTTVQANQYDEVAFRALATAANIHVGLSHTGARAGNRIRVTATGNAVAGSTVIVCDGSTAGTPVGEMVTTANAWDAACAEFTYNGTIWYRSILA